MSNIDWKNVWDSTLKNKELFPIKAINKNTVSVSCPTRFSKSGELSIDITPSFNDDSIVLELLVFNDNLSFDDLPDKDNDSSNRDEFNRLVDRLVEFELDNRIMERFKIKSDGFSSDTEAENTLIDYINSKATESGRMFDDKLDEMNDDMASKKEEALDRAVKSIRENRRFILNKIGMMLLENYRWKAPKNEDFDDTTASFYDTNGNLAAVVSLVDNFIVVDLAKGITARVSVMQSDEDIESELVADIDNANDAIADREISKLKDVVASNELEPNDPLDNEDDYLESLMRRVTKLESLYIKRRLRRI